MFGTIIKDSYKQIEAYNFAEAIDEICSPNDIYGWSSSGLYCFWDYYTSEIYYIGLAVDLAERFRQHNGIIKANDTSCKKDKIFEYFSKNDRLGYSIFVQSSLNQPKTHRNDEIIRSYLDLSSEDIIPNFPGSEGKELIQEIEGAFIESYKLFLGKLPKWNNIGGLRYGQLLGSVQNYLKILKYLTKNSNSSDFIAKSTIKELADSPMFTGFEINIHAIRMKMYKYDLSFEEAIKELENWQPFCDSIEIIKQQKYLNKELEL